MSRLRLPAAIILLTALGGVAAGQPQAQPGGRGHWRMVSDATPPLPRHEHAYVKAGDRFYLLGGRGSQPIKPVEIFDPASGVWRTGAAPPIELHHFQAVTVDGRIFVVGAMTGRFPTEPPASDVYVYDPAADRWSTGPSIPEGRRRGGAGVVAHEGKIYVVAGITNGHTDGHVAWLDVFDPAVGTWRQLPDAPRPRDHFHAAVIAGKLYAVGGRRSSVATGQSFELTVPEVDVFDLATSTWSTLPPASNLPTPRAGSTVAVLDGRLLVIGGESGTQREAHADVEALDPATGRWTPLAPLGVGRHATQAIVHDDRVYVAAGSRTRGATEITSHEVFTLER